MNGRVATLGQKADAAKDNITVDGKALPKAETLTYIALYKPRNVLSMVEGPDPRPTVRELVPIEGHLYPVGRLDFDSEGLILMTNDGDLTNKLTHPRYGHQFSWIYHTGLNPVCISIERIYHRYHQSDK